MPCFGDARLLLREVREMSVREAAAAAEKKKQKKPVSPPAFLSSRAGLDVPFFTLVMLLLIVGLIMMFSASHAYAQYHDGDSFFYIKKQLFFALIGFAAMMGLSYVDYHYWHKFALPILGISYLLLIIVLFLPKVKGVRRWIDIGFTTFQPSEIAKFALIIVFAHFISLNFKKMGTFKFGVLPFVAVMGSIALLMMLEPHISGTILILLLGAVMMFVGGTKLRWFGMVGGAAFAGIMFMIVSGTISYAMDRLKVWRDPWVDKLGDGWQNIQSLYAIGSGGLLGVGLGGSHQKYGYISEPQNDFVFAVVCEELGFVGAALIIVLFALLVWRGFVVALRSPDKFGTLMTIGLVAQVGLQAALNIAVVTKLIPNTGISLPFFSYGGTSLVMLLAQMGIVLSVSRSANLEKT